MLINAQRAEEVRVAIVSGDTLDTYQIAVAEAGLARGNIYRGVVVNTNATLNAAFVEFGDERDGMLPAHDVATAAYHKTPPADAAPRIDRILERGRPVLVQVTKDPIGSKGAALTTYLSFAGRYLVLTPFEDTRGISRKVEDDETRTAMREQADKLEVPEGCGIILRTNALGQTKTTLKADLAALLRLWKRVQAESAKGKGPRLLYSDQDLVVQALRDLLDPTIEEVLVDDDAVFDKAAAYMKASMPRTKTLLVRYAERKPLFSRFNLETQIEGIYKRTVPLPGGGSIVIDPTEALTAIDVNSGKASRGAPQEESFFAVNLEAAREVARQLRLRDIGGLVVVDFIDMRSRKHAQGVEKAMREAMKADKARSTVGRISANGLLEINRQRVKKALALRTHRPCPTCIGTGIIPSPEFVGLSLLRRIEARAADGRLKAVRVGLHPELADALQNGRRQELAALEREFEIRVEINATTSFHRSEERLEWVERETAPAPPSRAAVSATDLVGGGDLPEEAGGEKRRKRRRGGRRQGKERPATGADAGTEAATPADYSDQDLAGTEPSPPAGAGATDDAGAAPAEAPGGEKRRKRRRGGRRHKKAGGPPAVDEGHAPDQPASVDALSADEPASPPPAEDVGGDGAARKKRRRHRRRRKGPAEAGAQNGAAE